MAKILPGQLVLVEYVNGNFVNRWAVNKSKTAIEFNPNGRLIEEGVVDIMFDGPASVFSDNRGHFVGDLTQLAYLTSAGLSTQTFANMQLAVLRLNSTTDIFNSSGTKIGTLPAGTLVGTESGVAGNSNRHLMAAEAYNDGSGWKFLNQSTYSYGFINVQKGLGLAMYYNEKPRSFETIFSTPLHEDIDWASIALIPEQAAPALEAYLRDIPADASVSEVTEKVNDFFAAADLQLAITGDPEAYMVEPKNYDFLVRQMSATGHPDLQKFQEEKAHFLAL